MKAVYCLLRPNQKPNPDKCYYLEPKLVKTWNAELEKTKSAFRWKQVNCRPAWAANRAVRLKK